MDNRHRSLGWVVLVFIVGAASGCDGTDEGAWTRTPGDSPPSLISEPHAGPVPDQVVGHLTQGLVVDSHSDRRYWVRCDIAPALSIPVAVSGQVPSYPQQDRVCLGEAGSHPQPTLCKQVYDFEVHTASVTACYAKIRELLASRSKEVLGEHWEATVLPLIPRLWSKTPEEVSILNTRISVGMVNLINGGGGEKSASAAPLCFPTNGLNPELAALVAVNKIQVLVQGVTESLDDVTSALRRGINVQVNNDLKLELIAHFIEMPSPNIEPLDCRFEIPAAKH